MVRFALGGYAGCAPAGKPGAFSIPQPLRERQCLDSGVKPGNDGKGSVPAFGNFRRRLGKGAPAAAVRLVVSCIDAYHGTRCLRASYFRTAALGENGNNCASSALSGCRPHSPKSRRLLNRGAVGPPAEIVRRRADGGRTTAHLFSSPHASRRLSGRETDPRRQPASRQTCEHGRGPKLPYLPPSTPVRSGA